MTPDRAMLERDVAAAPFLEGAARGRWMLESIVWPYALFKIPARDSHVFQIRLNCEGYPADAPTGGLWDTLTASPPSPAFWPIGDAMFTSVFRREWQQGMALYMPLDRVSRNGHHDWPAQYPHLVWNPDLGVVQYLAEVHRLLNGRGYHGIPA